MSSLASSLASLVPSSPSPSSFLKAFVAVAAITLPLAIMFSRKPRRFPSPKVISENSRLEIVNGKELRICQVESEKEDAVLTFFLVHGLGGEMDQFSEQLACLSKFGRVIAIDFVGHGQSPSSTDPSDYSTEKIVKDLETIFEAYQTEKNIVIGHSYGSALSSKLVMLPSVRQHIAGLILIASMAIMPEGAGKLAEIPTWIIEIMRMFDRMGGPNSNSVHRMMHPSTPLVMRERQLGLAASNTMDNIKPLVRGMKWMQEAEWRALDVPLLLIHGEEDKATPLKGIEPLKTWCKEQLRGTYTLPETGHVVMLEKPAEVNQILENFVTKELHLN